MRKLFLHIRKERRSYPHCDRAADQCLCFRCKDNTTHRLLKYEISSPLSSSLVVQPGLFQSWSKTPKTGFLATRLNCNLRYYIKSGERCVLRGSSNFTCGFQGGQCIYIFFRGASGIILVMNQGLSRPPTL